ncbi:hypothetical protein [Halomarina pelagica]|uniref:hypothetical protein n=1 Tax=Halomarina pelagica TaxID=2961599 RepID=UPI0020C3C362|nr:hypothetical protein [Halomarina sp. BND7]
MSPTRREVLAGVIAAGGTLTGGCVGFQGSNASSEADCTTEAVSGADEGVIQQAVAAPADSSGVEFRVTVRNDSDGPAPARFALYDDGEEVAVIPVGEEFKLSERTYGRVVDGPKRGRYRVVAYDESGTELDDLVVSFECRE